MDVSIVQIIVIAAAVAFVARLHYSHQERQRRLEILHRERLAAIEKGIPLPELPLEPPAVGVSPEAPSTLFPGIVLLTFGTGSIFAFMMTNPLNEYWMLPFPIAFMGLGMIFYHLLSGGSRLRR